MICLFGTLFRLIDLNSRAFFKCSGGSYLFCNCITNIQFIEIATDIFTTENGFFSSSQNLWKRVLLWEGSINTIAGRGKLLGALNLKC
jgi:hypothetical protein